MKVRTEARRNVILEAAVALFKELGYERTSMNELAKRLGLSLVRHDVDSGDDIFEITRRAWFGEGASEP